MTQLTKNIYGDTGHQTSNLFGLRCGEICYYKDLVIKNAGWYNSRGERLGWGDLSGKDFFRIHHGLEEGEIFVTIDEISDSSYSEKKSFAWRVTYVALHARYFATKDGIFCTPKYNYDNREKEKHGGAIFAVTTRQLLWKRMTQNLPFREKISALYHFFAMDFPC